MNYVCGLTLESARLAGLPWEQAWGFLSLPRGAPLHPPRVLVLLQTSLLFLELWVHHVCSHWSLSAQGR